MSTIEAPTSTETEVIVGTVSTAPVYTKSLPDHVGHLSFHIDTAEGPGANIHAAGSLAELGRIAIHRRDHVEVTAERVYKRNPQQHTVDIDAAAINVTLH